MEIALIYLDTSALTKLVIAEDESNNLRIWLAEHAEHRLVSSALVRTELRRAVLRLTDRPDVSRTQAQAAAGAATALLRELDQIRLGYPLLDRAGHHPPARLRSLDAIHLVTAASLGPDLHTMVAYDHRLLDAARDLGIAVASPGMP
ncbi:type II toxin-antitoxin system VapC family toxin [Protofrankia symbiont of Coriaria ruscifolia]|uniref:type II toxin-antitoxin system VapC family toxin n=1 Tax=Protofrankia symbiont of Coriaria ruscifolia TaxID=1306542 RepID=UPI001A93C05E|nr:type II toxin-antitoxin system VapC family toxin [Protofrankia symbiont of Coriaria ruscifolia]